MEINQLLKSQQTVIEMLTDRGFTDLNVDLIQSTTSESREKIKEKMQMIVNGPCGKVLVRWPISPKLSSTECLALISLMKEQNIHNSIVIVDDSVTPHSKNTLRLSRQKGDIIEVFLLEEMQYNVSRHYLVPKHAICSKEEKKAVKKIYGNNLPEIKTTDPQIRYLGAKKGQIIKIVRTSTVLEGEKTVYYREVS